MSSTCESGNAGHRSGKIIVRLPDARSCDEKKGSGKRCRYLWQSGPSRRTGKSWRESTSSIT